MSANAMEMMYAYVVYTRNNWELCPKFEPAWALSMAAAAWALRWAALASIAAMRALAASLLDFPAQGEDTMDGPPPPPPAPRRNPVGGPPPHPAACLPDAWQRPIVSDARRWIWGVKENILNYSPFLASLIIESKDIP